MIPQGNTEGASCQEPLGSGYCLCLTTVRMLLCDTQTPKGGMTARERDRERAVQGTGTHGGERAARRVKTSKLYKEKQGWMFQT